MSILTIDQIIPPLTSEESLEQQRTAKHVNHQEFLNLLISTRPLNRVDGKHESTLVDRDTGEVFVIHKKNLC